MWLVNLWFFFISWFVIRFCVYIPSCFLPHLLCYIHQSNKSVMEFFFRSLRNERKTILDNYFNELQSSASKHNKHDLLKMECWDSPLKQEQWILGRNSSYFFKVFFRFPSIDKCSRLDFIWKHVLYNIEARENERKEA